MMKVTASTTVNATRPARRRPRRAVDVLTIMITPTTVIVAVFAFLSLYGAAAQTAASPTGVPDAGKFPPVSLRSRIPLPGVYGRMDHYGWDIKRGSLFVSALGNNSVEIINQWRRIHTITGLEHPQAAVYLPGVDRIAVSSQSGKLRFYDAATFTLIKTLDFGTDANTDNMRYDAAAKRLWVGYGERARGALASIDPESMERHEEFRVGSHPESFQLETGGARIFVNLPDQEAIGVVDRNSGALTKWKIPGNTNSHALAFDEKNRRLFTAALQPGRFAAIDAATGRVVVELPCVLGVDDLWFDADRQRIYATGSGAIDVFQQLDPEHYVALARVPVGAGVGSTSLYLRTRTQAGLYMSSPNLLPQGGSEVLLFYVND